MKKKGVLLGSLVAIILLAYYLLSQDVRIKQSFSSDNKSIVDESDNKSHSTFSNLNNTQLATTDEVPDVAKAYQACRLFNKNLNAASAQWYEKVKPSWKQLIDDGNTLDDVTAAIDFFQNPNFAVSFRVAQLRKSADLTQKNKKLNEEARALYPEVFSPTSGIRRMLTVPHHAFANFSHLSQKQKLGVLLETKPSVDDLAFFLHERKLSEADMLLLLKHGEDLSGIVGFDTLDSVSLLDYAVYATSPVLVEFLLKEGLPLSTDEYLGSTMDWALTSLMIEKSQDTADIVRLLMNRGGKASFDELSVNQISGDYPRRFFEFSHDDIRKIQQQFALDLTQIEKRKRLHVGEDSFLTQALIKSRDAFIAKQLSLEASQQQRSDCKDLISDSEGLWRPQSVCDILKSVINDDETQQISELSELSTLDPQLVDIRLKQTKPPPSFVKNTKPFDRYEANRAIEGIFRNLSKESILDVIDKIKSLQFSQSQNNYIALQILQYSGEYFDELQNSGLMTGEPSLLDYKGFRLINYSDIKNLHESGANLSGADIYGKTLVYYAVIENDLTLLRYLQEERFPFSPRKLGSDPLHAALQINSSERSGALVIFDMVKVLMKFSPKIDEFHLRRMALLKFESPQNYLHIIKDYPELEPKQDTPLPAIRLQKYSTATLLCSE